MELGGERPYSGPPEVGAGAPGGHSLHGAVTDALEALPTPYLELDMEGTIRFANAAFRRMAGEENGLYVGMSFCSLLHIEEESAHFLEAIGRMQSMRGHLDPLHLRIDTLGSGLLPVRMEWSPLHDASRRLARFSAMVIPQGGEAGAGGYIDDSRLKLAVTASELGIWEYDLAHDHFLLSASSMTILGIDQNQFKNDLDSFIECAVPGEGGILRDKIAYFSQARDSLRRQFRLEFPVKTPTGSRWVSMRGKGFARGTDEHPVLLLGTLFNVSEQKLTEQALRKSDEIFRQLTENVDGVFWMRSHEDNSLIYVSPGYEKIWGRPLEELFNDPDSIIEAIHPEDFERVKRESGLEDEDPEPFTYHLEYRILRPDGEVRWISDRAFPIRDSRGVIYRRAGLVTDITGRKESEAKLQLHNAALEAAANSIVLTNAKGMIEWVNPAFLSLTGYDRDEVVGKQTNILKSGVHDKQFYKDMWATVLKGEVWRGDIVNRRKDGSHYPEEMMITPVRESDGRIGHFIAIKQDITERKAGENALRENELKYRGLFEAAHDAIFLLSDSRIIDCNKHAEDLLGCGGDQILGMGLEDFAPIRQPDGRDSADCVHDLIEQAGIRGSRQIDWKAKRWNGSLFDADITASVFNLEDKPMVQIIVRDVSERRRMEERIQQNQRLEAIGRLAGGIAHDFNNLLLVINGHIELMMAQMDADDPGLQHLEKSLTAARHAADLTKQLLAFSRKQVLEPERIDVNQVVEESMKMLSRLIPENIRIERSTPPDVGEVMADPGQFRQIVLNLVVNARDAMPEGGSLFLSTRCVDLLEPLEVGSSVEKLPAGSYVAIVIEDTGSGIDPDVIGHIFDPFFTTKEKGRGTGLGLATVYGIVKQSGGDIAVESALGEGTTFTVYLPRAEGDGESMLPAAGFELLHAAPEGRSGVVFVVEDERSVRSLVSQLLRKAGYFILTAESPGEALQMAESRDFEPDLLIVDVILPEMRGNELARILKEKWPRMRVLLTSGYAEIGEIEPGSDFIQKPYRAQKLLAKVAEIMQS